MQVSGYKPHEECFHCNMAHFYDLQLFESRSLRRIAAPTYRGGGNLPCEPEAPQTDCIMTTRCLRANTHVMIHSAAPLCRSWIYPRKQPPAPSCCAWSPRHTTHVVRSVCYNRQGWLVPFFFLQNCSFPADGSLLKRPAHNFPHIAFFWNPHQHEDVMRRSITVRVRWPRARAHWCFISSQKKLTSWYCIGR